MCKLIESSGVFITPTTPEPSETTISSNKSSEKDFSFLKSESLAELQELLSSPENQKIFSKLMDFMPDDIFERLKDNTQQKYSSTSFSEKKETLETDFLTYFKELLEKRAELSEDDVKEACVIKYAYGAKSVRFSTTAALHYLVEVRANSGQETEGLNEGLETLYKKHNTRISKLDRLTPNGKDPLNFGYEIEIPPLYYLSEEDKKRLITVEKYKRQLVQDIFDANPTLKDKLEHESRGNFDAVKWLDRKLNDEDYDLSDVFNNLTVTEDIMKLASAIANTKYKHVAYVLYEKIEAITQGVGKLTGYDFESDLDDVFEIGSEPTRDVKLLAHELHLLSKLGIIDFDAMQPMRSKKSGGKFLSLHMTTGGLYPFPKNTALKESYKDDGFNDLHVYDPDILFLSHVEYASGLVKSSTSATKSKLSSILKGEMRPRGVKELGGDNISGIEERIFDVYDEAQMIRYLAKHSAITTALYAYQSVPSSVRNEMTNNINDLIHESDNFEDGFEIFCLDIEQLLEQLSLTDPLQKSLIEDWLIYRYKVSYVFRKLNLSKPENTWVRLDTKRHFLPSSTELADLRNEIGQGIGTYSDLTLPEKKVQGTPIQVGEVRYANIRDAMVSLTSDLSKNISNHLEKDL